MGLQMETTKTTDRYSSSSIFMHWVMLGLFILVSVSVEIRVLFERGGWARDATKDLHFMLGIVMLALVFVRLVMRARCIAPRIEPAPPKLEALAAKMAHLTLYALMIFMPVMGWLLLSAGGKPIPFFGLELPALIGANKELAAQLKWTHQLVGTIGYFLIGAHAAAALFHHYVQHDNTLLSMLPKWTSKK